MEMNFVMMMLMMFVCVVNAGIVDEVSGMVKKYVEDIKKDNYEFYIKERNFFKEVIDEVNEIENMKDNDESKYHKIKMLLIKIVFKIIMELDDDDDKENILNILLMISNKDIDIERDVISIITDYDNIHSHLERFFPFLNRNNNNNHSNISNDIRTNTSSLLLSNINQTISSIDHKMFEVFLVILLFLITYGTYLIKRNPIKNSSFETTISLSS